jgi:hypothetical protein
MTQKDSNYFSLISQGKEIKKGMDSKAQESIKWTRIMQASKGDYRLYCLRMTKQLGDEADALHRQLDRITQEIYVRYEDSVNL